MRIMFAQLSKKYGFNPAFLKQILILRNLGYNNTSIAEQAGISRVTVNSYIEKIKEYQNQNQREFAKLVLLCLGLYAGIKILEELFG